MSKETKISWCDSTVNPTGFQCCGCELWNTSQGVFNCYAGKFSERVGGKGSFDKPVVLKPGVMAKAAKWSDLRGKDRIDKPWLNGLPRHIFLGDMADVLQPGVPFDFLNREIVDVATSEAGRRHEWMLLTKQAKRLLEWSRAGHGELPQNLWVGVSVTSEQTKWRLDYLAKVPAQRKFVSLEPLLGPVLLGDASWLDVVIIGGESGKNARPCNIHHIYSLRDQCAALNLRCFIKQLGSNPVDDISRLFFAHPKGGSMAEWPSALRVRQWPDSISRQ